MSGAIYWGGLLLYLVLLVLVAAVFMFALRQQAARYQERHLLDEGYLNALSAVDRRHRAGLRLIAGGIEDPSFVANVALGALGDDSIERSLRSEGERLLQEKGVATDGTAT